MDILIEQARAALNALPPGPWTAYGTTVYAGSNIVAEMARKGPAGEQTARTLALLPDLIRVLVTVAPDTMLGKLVELEEKVDALEDKITDLEVELKLAREGRGCVGCDK